MKVFGYITSVILEGVLSESSILSQESNIRDFCRSNEFDFMAAYLDNSDHLNCRKLAPQFRQMVKDMVIQKVDAVVVESINRLSVLSTVQDYMVFYLASKRISLISVDTGSNITKEAWLDSAQKIMVNLQGMFTDLDKSLAMLKMQKAREGVRGRKGKCEGRKSYMEIAPATIREIKRLRRQRVGQRPRTFTAIARILNESGYLTASGVSFTGNNVSVILHRLKNT